MSGVRKSRREPWSAENAAILGGVLIFALIAFLSLREPTLAFGQAMGVRNVIIVLSIAFLATVLTGWGFYYLVDHPRWNLKITSIYLAAGLGLSMALNQIMIKAIDAQFAFAESVVESKVHYYCVDAYAPGQCVNQLNICPQCKRVFTEKERRALHDRLAQFALAVDHRQAQVDQARNSQAGPLSEAAQAWRQRHPASR